MPLKLFPYRGWPVLRSAGFQLRHNGRWRQRGRVQEIGNNVLAAQNRRGAIRHRSQRQETSLAQQSTSFGVCHRDASEAVAVDSLDAIVARQSLVHKRIVRIE